jgi:hypothetical protein
MEKFQASQRKKFLQDPISTTAKKAGHGGICPLFQ